MLLEFLAQNVPHTKTLMLFDSLGEIKEQKILGNPDINDYKIMQYIITNSKYLIKLATDKKGLEFSEIQLILLKDNIIAIRRIDQNKVLVILLSDLITLESSVLQYNNFVN